jgi:hypothetical protein
MGLASLCERRWGSQAAGLVAAAPVTVLVGVVLVSSDLSPRAARELALSTSGHALSQVALAVVFFHIASRLGTLGGLVAATSTYVGFAWLTTYITPPVAVALGVVAAIVGRNLLGPEEPNRGQPDTEPISGALVITLRAGVALTAAAGILIAAHIFGPSSGGAVGAYPMFSVTLACLIASGRGLTGLRNVLRGLVRALPAYMAFEVAYWLTAPMFGEVGGIAAATTTCCLTYSAVSRGASRSQPSSHEPTHPRFPPLARQHRDFGTLRNNPVLP